MCTQKTAQTVNHLALRLFERRLNATLAFLSTRVIECFMNPRKKKKVNPRTPRDPFVSPTNLSRVKRGREKKLAL